MTTAKSGDRVKIHYEGRLDDGSVFDSTRDREPFEFTVGSDGVIPGVSEAVVGMEINQKKTVQIEAENAYGPRHEGLEQQINVDQLPDGVAPGTPLRITAGENEFIFWVTDIGEEQATIDANHPLAGRDLTFDIEVVAIEAAAE